MTINKTPHKFNEQSKSQKSQLKISPKKEPSVR